MKGMGVLKINIQKIAKRLFPIVTAFCVILLCVAFPASAVEWKDLVYSTSVENGNVTYSLDLLPGGRYLLYEVYPYKVIDWVQGSNYVFDSGGRYGISYISVSFEIDQLFFTSGISSYNIDFDFDGISDDNAVAISSSTLEVNYYDSSLVRLGQQFQNASLDPSEGFSASFTPNVPSGTRYVTFVCNIIFDAVDAFASSFDIDYFGYDFTVPVSSVENLEILNKLEEQGQKLDDIINGTPEQNEQADRFQEDVNGAVGDLGAAGDALNQVPKPDVSVDDLVPNDILAGTAYLTYTGAIQEFWSSEILSTITVLLGGMVLISYLLFGEKG